MLNYEALNANVFLTKIDLLNKDLRSSLLLPKYYFNYFSQAVPAIKGSAVNFLFATDEKNIFRSNTLGNYSFASTHGIVFSSDYTLSKC